MTDSGGLHAFLWQPGANPGQGTMIDLGTLGGTDSFAYGINELGQVMGYSQTQMSEEWGAPHAFLWQPGADPGQGTMIDLGTLGGLYSVANGMNGSGKVVGQSTIASGDWHAFVWGPDGGSLVDLGGLGGSQSYANAINASSKIVGGSETNTGETHAVLWKKRR